MVKTPVALAVAAALLASCGQKSSSQSETANFIYSSVRRTTPVVQATGSPPPKLGPTSIGSTRLGWLDGGASDMVFRMLRDYDPSADVGMSVGIENLYKSLWMTGSFYDELRAKCGAITPTAIASPFPLGSARTYDCAVNDTAGKHGHASREAAGQKLGLTTWRVDYANGTGEMGVQQLAIQTASGDLALDQVDLRLDPGGTSGGLRYHVEGNPGTHTFTLRGARYEFPGYSISLVGAGVSRGAGNHFLFKVTEGGVANPQYLCYPADLTEAQVMSLPWSDVAGLDPACAGYVAQVDALVPFTSADVPRVASDFAGSSVYLHW